MPDNDLGTVFTVLRIIRGMSQEELAQASGIRSSTISDYERGRMVPGLMSLQRLLEAMGYPFGAMDQARALISSLRPDSISHDMLSWGLPDGPEALRREVLQISAEAGRVVARFIRLLFVMLSGPPVTREPSP
jgi:transcriptional regulator with XRE-family HTH domain